MTWATAKQAADVLRDLVREPHPRKFREAFNADTLLRLIDLLDPPLDDDPVRAAAVNALVAIDALIGESEGVAGLHLNGDLAPWGDLTEGGQFEHWLLPLEALRDALANSPPSIAAELHRTRQHMALQGGQLFRLGVALKLVRVFCISEVELPASAVVRAFFRGWVDDSTWPPLSWPDVGELPDVSRWLSEQGYANIDGAIGVWITSNRDDPQLGRDFAL